MSKLQKLTKNFDNLTMDDDETLDDLYDKLNDIINTSFNLGENMLILKLLGRFLYLCMIDSS